MFQREIQISPLIVSKMIQTHDEVSISHDLLIAGSINSFGVFMTSFKFIAAS